MDGSQSICFRCGRNISDSAYFYNIDLTITSGFNGIIKAEANPELIRKILTDLSEVSALEAEEDVYKEINITLCKNCKDELIKLLVGSDENKNLEDRTNY